MQIVVVLVIDEDHEHAVGTCVVSGDDVGSARVEARDMALENYRENIRDVLPAACRVLVTILELDTPEDVDTVVSLRIPAPRPAGAVGVSVEGAA